MSDIDPPEAEAVLDRLIQAVPGGVVYVAADGAVLRANDAALAFLGYSYDALTRRYTRDFAGDTWLESGEPCRVTDYPVTEALTTRNPAGPKTIGVQQPDGNVRWAVFRAVPVDGGGAVVTFLDITERRERQRRLAQSERLASLGRLAAGVAHEINNPLTWVMLKLEQALDQPTADDSVREALAGLERVASIVDDLNALSRVDRTPPVAFDVHPCIERAIALSQTEARHRAVLRVAMGDQVPPAFGEPSRVVQILLNLVLNAVQSIPPGARKDHQVTVHTTVDGDHVEISVTDTGPGMEPRVLDRALDPFFTTKAPGEGTGLGLAISHALAVAMDGELRIDSQLGKGTRARLRLPVATVPVAAEPVTGPTPTPARPRRILVIDDEPQITKMLVWALRPHEVTTASDGREALARIRQEAPDLIVCDLMMPEITGMMVHATLATERPELLSRIVFITGGVYTPEARAFVERDDVVCLAKPFTMAQLQRQIEALLD